jgi:phosphoribosylcarboxyaminoimidazole (NCAIR) mutase
MERILFLGAGSKDDPGFDDIHIEGMEYKDYMREKGITVIDKVIESCHGCHGIMTGYSNQMQSLVEEGNRVVAVLEGGLTFGLPSIQATQTTYPIISCPMDLVAYQAFIVPSGHAVMAGVGVDKGDGKQKEKALKLAGRMLTLNDDTVGLVTDVSGGKLSDELAKFEIESDWAYSESDGKRLSLACGTDYLHKVNTRSFLLRADDDENLKDWGYFRKAEERHHQDGFNVVPTAQVRGLKNLVIYTAKVLSLQRPELRERLIEIATKKRDSYETRDLVAEIKRR